jgi:O-antigen/teichoic acid export membrane protein
MKRRPGLGWGSSPWLRSLGRSRFLLSQRRAIRPPRDAGPADSDPLERPVNPSRTCIRPRSPASQLEPGLKARLARGSAGAFTINLVGTGVAFLAQLVLARVLGAESYGIYAYVSAWVAVLGLLATLGFQTGILRFASAYVAREEWGLARGVIRYAERRVVLAGLAVAAAGFVTILAYVGRLPSELAYTFLVGFAIVPALALLQVRASLLRAFGRVVAALAPNQLVRQLVILLGAGALGLALAEAVRAPLAIAVTLAATLLSLAVASFSLRRARPSAMAHAKIAEERAVWRAAAAFMLLMAGAQILMRRADVLMLGWFADTTTAGIYTVACRITELVSFALTAVNIIFAPTISALHAQGDRASLQALVTMTAWWVTVSAVAVAAPLFIFAEASLRLFGEAFVAGADALRILLLGQLINAAAGSVAHLLTMTGLERQAAFIILAATVGSIALNAVLIPAFGMEGAAITSALTTAAWNVGMAVFLWTKLGIVPSILGSVR